MGGLFFFFFFNDTATTEIYTLSLHDALPISDKVRQSLSIYSAKDIATMTTDEGTVTADCQFCGAHYTFDPDTLGFEAKDASA